jgi:hypothetical protein
MKSSYYIAYVNCCQKYYNFDDIVKNPIYCVAAFFCSFDIPYVWSLSQKTTTPCISNFYDAVQLIFYEFINFG